MIPRTMHWRDKQWEPCTPNGTSRYELLSDMWALYDFYSRRYTKITLAEGATLIKAVCAHRVLSHTQIAKMTGRSRQRMHIYMQENGLPIAEGQGARGILNPEMIGWLKEMIVRKLARNEYVYDVEIAKATEAGSDSLVSILTGIPAETLKNARQGKVV